MELDPPIYETRVSAGRSVGRIVGVALCVCLLPAAGGCTAPAVKDGDIQSDAPAEKIPAIVVVADTYDEKDYHRLVTALDNNDSAVRMFAGEALYRITGDRKGYRYYDGPDARRAAVDRWRAWEQQLTADANTVEAAPTGPGSQSGPQQEAAVAAGTPAPESNDQ